MVKQLQTASTKSLLQKELSFQKDIAFHELHAKNAC